MRILVLTSKYGKALDKRDEEVVTIDGHTVKFAYRSYRNVANHRMNALTPRARSKYDRCFAWSIYPGHDVYVHTDSTVTWKSPEHLTDWLKQMNGKLWLGFKHPQRTDVLEEAKYIEMRIKNRSKYHANRYEGEDLVGQAESYKQAEKRWVTRKMPLMMENTIFAYHAEEPVRWMMREWYLQCMMWSMQDQISLPYVMATHEVQPAYSAGTCKQNHWTTWSAKDHFE